MPQTDSFSVLIGPNGAGKSTLLYAILGFVKLGSGAVWVCGKDIRSYHRLELARLISYVPQVVVFQFDYLVEDIVLMGRYPWLQMMQSWSNEDRQLVHGVLEQMELLELRNRYFSQLSGGEKQRVLIARALAQNSRFIFLDETLSQLDINHQIEIMKMLKTIRQIPGRESY
jgi:iron complex transport system ATP-binding protein